MGKDPSMSESLIIIQDETLIYHQELIVLARPAKQATTRSFTATGITREKLKERSAT